MEFRLLGPTEVVEGDEPITLGGHGPRALLALLLLQRGAPISTERLVDELWDASPPPAATNTVQQYVSQLRKQLGSDRIVTRPAGYALTLTTGELDVERFEMLLRGERIHDALALWRGSPLADFESAAFAQLEIRRLEELRLAALERRVELDLERGVDSDLVAELTALVEVSPYRERLRGQLMLALYRSGRQVEALECYRAGRAALVEGLGIEPGEALQALERAILRHDASLDIAAGEPRRRPERPVLVVAADFDRLGSLLPTAEVLVTRPRRELLVAALLPAGSDARAATGALSEYRTERLAEGRDVRVVAYASAAPGDDVATLATEQDAGLVIVDASAGLTDGGELAADWLTLLLAAPCDVGILAAQGRSEGAGPIVVPFGGLGHEWAAVELAAWIARNRDVPLRLAGVRSAGRLLARGSLAVQAAIGVVAEPLLVDPGTEGMRHAAEGASLVVLGLSDTWRREGVGTARRDLIRVCTAPVLLVRRGDRPGGLAPPHTITRFSWTDAAANQV